MLRKAKNEANKSLKMLTCDHGRGEEEEHQAKQKSSAQQS